MYMQEPLQSLFKNPIFYAPVFGWMMAQLIKTVIGIFITKEKKKDESYEDSNMFYDVMASFFWKTGGMPSSHSSMVTALTTAIAIEEGISSTLFLISFFFSAIVIRDASGVRQTIGILGKKLNTLVEMCNNYTGGNLPKIKVVEGHSTSEVFVGVLLGFFVGVVVCLF